MASPPSLQTYGPATADSQISAPAALAYWNNIPSTVDGMLGGFPQVSRIDLRGSLTFLTKLRRSSSGLTTMATTTTTTSSASPSATTKASSSLPLLSRGVDCGAGIGRVTAGFLSRVCATIDIVEPVSKFAEQAQSLDPEDMAGPGRIGQVTVCGLEDWDPASAKPKRSQTGTAKSSDDDDGIYDLIWNQWCVGHLTDEALVRYLERSARSLRKGGWIVVKENIASANAAEHEDDAATNEPGDGDLFDDLDSSVTRTDVSFRAIFGKANLRIVRTDVQNGFPKALGLHPVRFYALQPKD